MTKLALEKIRELDEQREKLMAGAKSEALKKIDRVLKELKDLGFNYRLVAEGEHQYRSKKAGARWGKGKGRVKNGPCKICSFVTLPPHDARTHRSQSKKAPFTNQELGERGLRRKAS